MTYEFIEQGQQSAIIYQVVFYGNLNKKWFIHILQDIIDGGFLSIILIDCVKYVCLFIKTERNNR